MAKLHIVREHALGLAAARKVAYAWAEKVESEYGMECTYAEGKTSDTVEFSRTGVKGSLEVTKSGFELQATLGLLLGAFKDTIEKEIVRELDSLLSPVRAKSRTK